MKQVARKLSALSLVQTAPEPHETAPSASLNEFFDGWLTSVSPTLAASQPTRRPSTTVFSKSSLSSADVMRVIRATVRESSDHRHWPPDVVQKFMRADVIKRSRQ
ncbi:MAG TPA: hypothetical protein VJV03_09080 [Pyrinomonadaceae bacterium]|nr:hypothetical protein [Pyrinomonadaceae bacterium]